MARPIKTGLDYFPMDVNTDDKFELIEARYGLIGFGIIIKLYQKIYKEGYYIDWTEEKLLLFKKAINVDINVINDVINDCLKYNIFNEELFKKYKILTSTGIQKRYLAASVRKKELELIKKYIIININEVNVTITWINVCNGTQSKVKKSRVEETKYPFDAFWDLYDKKRSMAKCEVKYNKLPEEIREKIFINIPKYKAYKPDVQYRKDPETYLNNKSWDDEYQVKPKESGFPR